MVRRLDLGYVLVEIREIAGNRTELVTFLMKDNRLSLSVLSGNR